MSTQRRQSTLKAASNRIEFPFAAMPIELSYHNSSFNGKVFFQVITDYFRASRVIKNSDKRIANLTKILPATFRIINSYRKINLLDVRRNSAQIHMNLLIIALARACAIIAAVDDSS